MGEKWSIPVSTKKQWGQSEVQTKPTTESGLLPWMDPEGSWLRGWMISLCSLSDQTWGIFTSVTGSRCSLMVIEMQLMWTNVTNLGTASTPEFSPCMVKWYYGASQGKNVWWVQPNDIKMVSYRHYQKLGNHLGIQVNDQFGLYVLLDSTDWIPVLLFC